MLIKGKHRNELRVRKKSLFVGDEKKIRRHKVGGEPERESMRVA